jgi:hypothetical protein
MNIPQSALITGTYGPFIIPAGAFHYGIEAVSSAYYVGASLQLYSSYVISNESTAGMVIFPSPQLIARGVCIAPMLFGF